MTEPFVISGNKTFMDIEKIEGGRNIMKDFFNSFNNSTLKVTEGRAQMRLQNRALSDDIADLLHAPVKELPIHFTPGPQLEDGFHVKLKEPSDVSVFVLAAGSMSVPRYELRGLPCLRAFTQGTRVVLLYLLSIKTKRMQRNKSKAIARW